MNVIDNFERATAWTSAKVAGAADQLDASTPCAEWNVKRLLDHMLFVQQMFAAAPSGGTVAPPAGPPPELLGHDPAGEYEEARKKTIHAFSQPGVIDGMLNEGQRPAAVMLGIAFCDQLVHGWDLAKATGQDTTMPPDLAAAAWQFLNGSIPDERRGPGNNFEAAVAVPENASDQDKLVAYCGRTP
jgi:uncharacterized protein (TIGR03086 family)